MENSSVSPADVKVQLQQNGSQQPQKTKAQLKAERREKQEAQRAAKAKLKEAQAPGGVQKQQPKQQQKKEQNKPPQKPKKKDVQKQSDNKQLKKLDDTLKAPSSKDGIFSHLKQYDRNSPPTSTLSYSSSPVHPAFVKLGIQMARETIVGSNGRCAALICAVKIFIQQYRCPKSKEVRQHLNIALKPCFNYLSVCRLFSVSMENFVKFIKHTISKVSPEISLEKAREELLSECDRYFEENIYLAAQAITTTTVNRINDGDTILIYGRSQLILRILLAAKKEGRKFRVMVVDNRPDLRGVNACERLTEADIPCSYVYINSATYVMKDQITKVLLSADALLANGYVLGPVGTAMLALIAHKYNKPVIVCCETYKFSERVQTDSILFNELADPKDMLKTKTGAASPLSDDADHHNVNLVNLVYDATPPTLVSIVITEIAELPCSSAPVILRRDTERRC
ncbi:translation initiation factor eIF2B subunit delta-like isoform X2 [Bolinopsis microptera]|uniref:translation initiation factor eIF2B subunit delta-like isoform X2 n=1 Tax=Bolinopsis microptera TaxID=2820187 RepID=UPI00307AE192